MLGSIGRSVALAICACALGVAPAAASAPDVALTLTGAPSPATVGQPLTFTLTIVNHGEPATGVHVTDALPPAANLVSTGDARCTPAPQQVDCSLGTLATDASVTVGIVVTPTAAGQAKDTATATFDESATRPSATATVPVFAPTEPTTLTGHAQASALVGEPITDTVTLGGDAGPTGTLAFALYGPDDAACATPIATSTAAVAGAGSYGSAAFTPAAAGVYRWVASYGGDSANDPAGPTACADAAQAVTVKAVPTLTFELSRSGSWLGASATLSGGSATGGAIAFSVYGPGDEQCTSPLTIFSVGVAGNGVYSSPPYGAPGPGTYRWIVSYGGDARNANVRPSACADPAATLTVPAASADLVGPLPAVAAQPSNAFKLRRTSATPSGRVSVALEAPGPGVFKAGAGGYSTVVRTLKANGRVTLTLLPGAKARRALRRHTRVKVAIRITFTPAGGKPKTRTTTVTVKPKRAASSGR